MPKPRVIFDTNVFVRALISPGGVNARLIQSRRLYTLFTSPAILQEVTEVLARIDLLQAKAIRNVEAERLLSTLRRVRRVSPTITARAVAGPRRRQILGSSSYSSGRLRGHRRQGLANTGWVPGSQDPISCRIPAGVGRAQDRLTKKV
ncbi:MAG: PIN domain-containing protein [Armatimonadetes bacterium]|nr:PIN domain-containing protein [Armatimonadota bacterium]